MVCTLTLILSATDEALAEPVHGAAEPAPTSATLPVPEEPLPLAGYDKGFFIQSPDGDFRLCVTGRVQFRFTYQGRDSQLDDYFFSVPRARLKLTGHAFSPDLTFGIHTDFGMGGVPTLKDAYLDYGLVPGVFHARAGQYKKPFSRQQLSSGVKLNLVERAITDGAFGTGRDLGVMVHNDYGTSPPFEYALGVFNGRGDKATVDTTTGKQSNVAERLDPVAVARIGYNHGPIKGYDEADFDGGPLRFSITGGPQVWSNLTDEQRGAIELNAELLTKAHGFTSQAGIFAGWEQEGPDFGDQDYRQLGIYVEAGYLIGKLVQPSARWARVMPKGSDNDTIELLGGLNVFAYGHNVKLVIDGGGIIHETPTGRVTDYRVRSQVQLQL
jgi:hypothetical protein